MNKEIIETYLEEFSTIADNWFKKESWLEEWFQFYQLFFTKENLQKANWTDFQEMGNRIHSFNSMAIAKGNALGRMNLPIEEYRRIFQYIISNEDPINTTINNLYKKYNGTAFLPYFSDSSISELIANALPNKYVLYNRRDLKALEILGLKLENVRGEKFGDLFLRYNEFLKPLLEKYQQIVGKRTNTTINLELDQFFSWLYLNKKADKPIKDLIENYKSLIKSNGLKNNDYNEIYKWELIRSFKGRPNLDNDIFQELNEIKFNNVIYHLSLSCIKSIAREYGDDLKKQYKALFDESKDLNDRINTFIKNTLKLYKKTGGENSHHQDERSISAYLTLNNPSEYTFYKSSYYKEYCKLINEKHAKPKQKYSHYLDLIKELAENYIAKDQELISFVNNEIKDLADCDPNYLLLAQDILYQLLDADRGTSYWVFQGNPEVFDFETALSQEILNDWTVSSSFKEKIKVGDKVIFWITGDQSGCYALAEVTSRPHQKKTSTDEYLWKSEDKSVLKADIKITHNLVNNPILSEDIKDLEELNNLKVGNDGTNFSATQNEYNTLIDISAAESKFQSTRAKFDSKIFDQYIKSLRKLNIDLKLTPNDPRIVYSVRGYRLNLIIGQRYCLNIFTSDDRGNFGVISEEKLKDTSESFDGKPPQPYYNYYDLFEPNNKEWSSVLSAIKKELSRTKKSGYKKYNDSEFENYVFELSKETIIKNDNMELILNTILYGPPGTGKTYHTVNKAVKICDPKFFKDHSSDREQLKSRYNELVKDGQIVFTTFHQSTSYEDFIEGIKPKMNENNRDLEYQIEDGIFKEIAQKAIDQKNTVDHISADIEISKEKFKLPINKFSLGDATDKEDDIIIDYCFKNDCIALGFGDDINFTGVKDIGDIRHRCQEYGIDVNGTDKFTAEAVKRFIFSMKKGQLVLISNGNRKLRAIAEISGDYYCDPSAPIRYAQFRNVKWLYKDLDYPIKEIYGSYFSQQTIYQMHSSKFDMSYFSKSNELNKSAKNYVLIIDEINRGNVSSIFGELITLIEPDKRDGNKEALSLTLPYSKESFKVPSNLYIIGTMNTADRSVEALDTALRRRFAFEEMLPKPEILTGSKDLKISLESLLTCINQRIEALVDRDHTIGHSYLINVKNMEDLKLAFKDKIIPLLQEYFYGDYGKIGLVLGGGFVKLLNQDNEIFADFEYDGSDGLAQNKFELVKLDENFDLEQALEKLLKNTN